ncbi:type VI secretion system membrane subunit TssM [Cronobacter turicensis]|nr:type VI secretion system membrane subunit TssM [Cronobacter turicensis]
MTFLNRLFSGRSLTFLLMAAWFFLMACAIGYLGPYIGFGEARPFAPAGARLLFIALALLWLVALWYGIPLCLPGALTVCAAIWVAGPYVLIGERYPLQRAAIRLAAIAAIMTLVLLYAAWRLLLFTLNHPEWIEKLRFRKNASTPNAALSEVAGIIRDAQKFSRRMYAQENRWRRFFSARTGRDAPPCWLVLGPEGAGKTSLVLSSGQEFPLPEQLNRTGKENPPTASCECFFANDALFIDTSGKYVSQAGENRQEWQGLLQAIRKYRPATGINGALLAFSARDILGLPRTQQLELAATLRARLEDLRTILGACFPVYLIVTKIDELTGFDAWFRHLTAQEREQVWGVTFPWGGAKGAPTPENAIADELRLLENRLCNAVSVRHQEEYAVADRKKMYAVPQDFRLLAQSLTALARPIFFASRYDETQVYSTLRGVYFTSSCQPESLTLRNSTTLVQTWRQSVTQAGIDASVCLPEATPEDERPGPEVVWGKRYFLRRLFADIIIKDAGLVRYNLRAQSTYRVRNLAGHVVCLTLCFFLARGLLTSYAHNRDYLEAVSRHAKQLQSEVHAFINTRDLPLLPTLLNTARDLAAFPGLVTDEPEMAWRYGLYTGAAVSEQADTLYHYFLQRLLFPLIERDATARLNDALQGGDQTRLFDALKRYLMLTGEERFDLNYLIDSITHAWSENGKIAAFEEKAVFTRHLNALFSQPEWRRFGQPRDENLVRAARKRLAQTTLTTRLWGRVRDQLEADAPQDLTLDQLAGESSAHIFTLSDKTLLARGIPGLYTQEGYHQIVKKKLPLLLTSAFQDDRWIMGNDKGGLINPVVLRNDVLMRYLDEYAGYWERLLNGVTLLPVDAAQSAGMAPNIFMLRTLAAANSPLVSLVREAVKQTTLTAKGPDIAETLNLANRSALLSNAKRVNDQMAFQERRLLQERVDNRFAALREFYSGSPQPDAKTGSVSVMPGSAFNRVIGELNDQYTLFVMYDNALQAGDPPALSEAARRLAVESDTWPAPLKNIIAPLLNHSFQKVEGETLTQQQGAIAAGPGELCRRGIEGRYPLSDSDQEISLNQFERFFGAGGALDAYFQAHLADSVDTTASPWRYKGRAQGEGLGLFEQGAALRSALFQGENGRKVALDLSVAVVYMDPSITRLQMQFDDVTAEYSHGPVTPLFFHWPGGQSANPIRLSARPAQKAATSELSLEGSWSLLHWVDTASQVRQAPDGKTILTFYLNKRRVDFEVTGLNWAGRFVPDLLKSFACPAAA